MLDPFVLIAHRGDRRYAPENTLIAFRQARAKGAGWVEFDATLTRNPADPVVIFHDDTVGRTTSLPNRPLTEIGFAELRAADAGHWFGEAFADERVPTLTEAVRLCDGIGLSMNIEIKVSETRPATSPEPFDEELARTTARRVIEDVQAVRGDKWDNILLSSFSTLALEEAARLVPTVPRGYLVHRLWPEDEFDSALPEFSRRLVRVMPSTVNLNHELLSSRPRLEQFQAAITRALGASRPILVYTVNDLSQAKTLQEWGVSGLFTDAPGDLATGLKGAGAPGH